MTIDGAEPADIWVHVVTSQAIVRAGVKSLLDGREGIRVITGGRGVEADVVLYDVIGMNEGDGSDLDCFVASSRGIVLALTRELRPDLGAAALQRGALAPVSIGASAEQLAAVIRAAVSGQLTESSVVQDATTATRLGWEAKLTGREAQVLGLIVQGMSNHDIADQCGLSVNSIKSYIRNAYRKMGVETRAQAVAWGIGHGFLVGSTRSASHSLSVLGTRNPPALGVGDGTGNARHG